MANQQKSGVFIARSRVSPSYKADIQFYLKKDRRTASFLGTNTLASDQILKKIPAFGYEIEKLWYSFWRIYIVYINDVM